MYAEQRDLCFFLYEKHLAMKYFNAHVRAHRMKVTGDVMARSSQTSAGYWDIVQDSLAELVRIMLVRYSADSQQMKGSNSMSNSIIMSLIIISMCSSMCIGIRIM